MENANLTIPYLFENPFIVNICGSSLRMLRVDHAPGSKNSERAVHLLRVYVQKSPYRGDTIVCCWHCLIWYMVTSGMLECPVQPKGSWRLNGLTIMVLEVKPALLILKQLVKTKLLRVVNIAFTKSCKRGRQVGVRRIIKDGAVSAHDTVTCPRST